MAHFFKTQSQSILIQNQSKCKFIIDIQGIIILMLSLLDSSVKFTTGSTIRFHSGIIGANLHSSHGKFKTSKSSKNRGMEICNIIMGIPLL